MLISGVLGIRDSKPCASSHASLGRGRWNKLRGLLCLKSQLRDGLHQLLCGGLLGAALSQFHSGCAGLKGDLHRLYLWQCLQTVAQSSCGDDEVASSQPCRVCPLYHSRPLCQHGPRGWLGPAASCAPSKHACRLCLGLCRYPQRMRDLSPRFNIDMRRQAPSETPTAIYRTHPIAPGIPPPVAPR